MNIRTAKYVISAVEPSSYPEQSLPDIAFIGRSNVGKSSLINCLINRKKLAKTSSVPGKTQCVNFYDINSEFHFVDLPGYGFTRAPESVSRNWRRSVDVYFETRQQLKLIFQLIDIRHPPSALDIRVSTWLRSGDIAIQTLAVKADKVKKRLIAQQCAVIRKVLQMDSHETIIPCSAKSKIGKTEVWDVIERALEKSVNLDCD